MLRALRGVILFGAALITLTILAVFAWSSLWSHSEDASFAPADAIVCLGGDMRTDGTLGPAARPRVERCVALWAAGKAPVVIFTGDGYDPDGPAEARSMARYAATLGLSETATLIEPEAQSTLQNALFSLPFIPDAQDLILVTEPFHLPRSGASFHWAAWELGRNLTLQYAASAPLRRDPDGSIAWRIHLREVAAIWFNLARATVYTAVPSAPVSWLH